jgi:hypothetical protein
MYYTGSRGGDAGAARDVRFNADLKEAREIATRFNCLQAPEIRSKTNPTGISKTDLLVWMEEIRRLPNTLGLIGAGKLYEGHLRATSSTAIG